MHSGVLWREVMTELHAAEGNGMNSVTCMPTTARCSWFGTQSSLM